MIRTGEEYCAGLRDGREVWIDGERVQDVAVHPAFKPVVDHKVRMYDMAHESAWAEIMNYHEDNQRFSILLRPPTEKGALAQEMARDRHLSERHLRHPDPCW